MNLDKKMIKNSIPQIRFKGFDVVWVEKRIEDIVKISAGGDVDKEKLKENGKYPVIANALTNKGIVGYYDDYKVKAPAVTVTGRGDVGYAVARHENFTPVVRLLTLQSDSIDVDYLENQINSMKILNESTGVPQLTAPQLGNYKVYHPEIEEQSAIGSLFHNLDDLLASYKDNLANYQSLKATMLSKMFPKAGQTVPEIRLDGFEGEWENKILSEVTNITMGQSPKSENYTDNPNDYILVQGNADIKDKQVVPRLWTTEVTKIAEIGDIILTVRAPVGDIGKTDYNVVIGRGVAAIKGNDFIFYTLEKMKMTGFWNKFSTGSTFESISSNDIKEAIIQIPTLKEQQAIGSYFSNLDNLITSHQEKISQLETLKKKLLQDMFI
jgi:type I restriction-modification system specificty subunit